MRPEELRGRSMGALVLAGVGLAWAGPALSRLSRSAAVPLLVVSVAVFAVLIFGGFRVRRAAFGLSPSVPEVEAIAEQRRRVGRRFALVVGGESAAIAAAVGILNGTGHPHLIPAVICAAVGLHFVPLAATFKVRLYYGTAAALCLLAVATLILVPATGAPPSLWQVLPGLGAAVSLWATSALLIAESLALIRVDIRTK